MYTKPVAPLSIGGVLDDAIKLYRASFHSCWVLSLIGAIALGAVGIYLTSHITSAGITSAGLSAAQSQANLVNALAFYRGTSFVLAELGVYLVSYLVYTALLAQMNSVALGNENPSAIESVGLALRRLPGAIVAGIAFSIAVGVGMVLFLVPGIYLWGKLQFWLSSMVADDVGALESLGRSWEATRQNWWRSTTSLTVALIMIVVLTFIDVLISGAAGGGLVAAFHLNVTDVLIVAQIVRAFVYIFVLPMLPAALLAIYYDMKVRRGGDDLLARANSLKPA